MGSRVLLFWFEIREKSLYKNKRQEFLRNSSFMFRELNFPIIRADVLEMSVFHLESAFDCAELDKAEPFV